jgi:formate dehydrogenase subunit gamma
VHRVSAIRISIPKKVILLRFIPLVFAALPFLLMTVLAQGGPAGQPSQAPAISEENQACLNCHGPDAGMVKTVHPEVLAKSPHPDHSCTDCHTSFTADFPHTKEMKADKVDCSSCHSEEMDALSASVHKPREGANAGDVPTCVSCHAVNREDPHSVIRPADRTRQSLVNMCTPCHDDHDRMARNGVAVDSVESYENSFHGKALMRFGKLDTAICVDCHFTPEGELAHPVVLQASNPQSNTNRANLAKTCGKCHPGATMNFSNSGFNHLQMTIREEPVLHWIETFFKVLTFSVLALLLLGIALDLRVNLIGPKKGQISPAAAILIALSFSLLIASIVLGVLKQPIGFYTTIAAVGTGVGAAVAHVIYKRSHPKHANGGRRYKRFTVSHRIQHLALMISFITLVVTGMPIRFPQNDVLRSIYLAMGGIDAMRLTHRVAAVILIAAWIYHTIELLARWAKAGFSFKSWTMWPSLKDVRDVVDTIKYNLGFTPKPPDYGRFQFREKFDYFAVYWGMPIMVASGLILWFPVYFSNILPELGIGAAYIAHADEAVLAFLTIATWHFYNTHFHPDHFPMNPVFITGELSEEAMREHHGAELKEIQMREGITPEESEAAVEPEPSEPDEQVEPMPPEEKEDKP